MEQEGIKFVSNAEVGDNVEAQLLLTRVRRHRALHRRDPAARPSDRGPRAQGRPLRDGVPHANTKACSTAARTSADPRARARTWSSSAAATPAPTASAPRCATAARAWCRSRSCRSRRWSAPPDNPWPEWPKVYKLDYGQEEAAAQFGADPRVLSHDGEEFVGDARGSVEGARHRRRASGRATRRASSCRGSARHREDASRAARAARDGLPRARAAAAAAISASSASRAPTSKAEHGKYATSIQGVFAAGDCRRGQSLVVWAINEGRGAARECDRYLMGGQSCRSRPLRARGSPANLT